MRNYIRISLLVLGVTSCEKATQSTANPQIVAAIGSGEIHALDVGNRGIVFLRAPQVPTGSSALDLSIVGLHGGEVRTLSIGPNPIAAIAVDTSHIYWYDGKSIRRVAKQNGQEEVFIEAPGASVGAISADEHSLFWWDDISGDLWQASTRGSGERRLLATEQIAARIAADARYVYWARMDRHEVTRIAKLGGVPKSIPAGPLAIASSQQKKLRLFSANQEIERSGCFEDVTCTASFRKTHLGKPDALWILPSANAKPIQVLTAAEWFGTASFDSENVYWVGPVSKETGVNPIYQAPIANAGHRRKVAIARDASLLRYHDGYLYYVESKGSATYIMRYQLASK